ncbi:MAG TPA: GH116 family glycosyl hydrolase [Longimicrobiales bacterium]
MLRVLYVADDGGAEERAAWAWLAGAAGIDAVRAAPDAVPSAVADARPDVVWLHAAAPLDTPPAGFDALLAAGIGMVLSGGAAALPAIVGLETTPPNDVVRRRWRDEDDELYLFKSFSTFPHIRGHAAFRGHPLFAGLGGATYTWWPARDEPYTAVTYRAPCWPATGRVVAVERSYIHVNAARATVWEYDADGARREPAAGAAGERGFAPGAPAAPAGAAAGAAGTGATRPGARPAAAGAAAFGRPGGGEVGARVLCIGAYLQFSSSDPLFRPLLERFAWNALHYAAGGAALEALRLPGAVGAAAGGAAGVAGVSNAPPGVAIAAPARRGFWRLHRPSAREDATLELPAPPSLDAALPPFDPSLRQAGDAAADDPFTLAGRRTLVAGGEARGVDEVWVHPLRVVKALRHEAADAVGFEVTPVGVERRLRVGGCDVVERVFVPRGVPAAIVEWRAPEGAELSIGWRTDLRLMWPYPAGALGPLRWKRDGRTLLVRADEPDDAAVFVVSREPDAWEVEGDADADAPAVRCRLRLRLAPGEAVRLAIAATTEGDAALAATLDALRPDALVRARAAAYRRIRRERLALDAPDDRVGVALEWAKARLDAFLVETPGLGRSLVAGYWTGREGWNDGRPGYAWYFGRDAVWTALGSLACGDFDAARDVIRFLGAHQDLSGKILHEATTSGVVHYDSADATPLYLLLVARYLAWTGDAGFVRGEWARVKKAYAFCLSTDTDGDGLIENTRVGHGWIEFGRLGGGTVTYYNASIWAAALAELVAVAEALGDRGFAEELRERAARARVALETTFWDHESGGYALNVVRAGAGGAMRGGEAALGETAVEGGAASKGVGASGDASRAPARPRPPGTAPSWHRNLTPTVMQAVPLLLGQADARKAAKWLDAIATDDFTAPWGVRMVPASDPEYNAGSYHGGAVWPLYTGWVSWAEYAAGRGAAAFRHWLQNVEACFARQKGAWDEVLHGLEHRAAGVCPDQAWSTAMAVCPLVYGLLGAEPDAAKGRLRLRPQIPEAWDRLAVRRLRMGDATVSLDYRRDGDRHTFRLVQEAGSVPVTLIFEPMLPARRLAAARVDGEPAELDPRPHGERMLVPVQLVLDAERVVELDVAHDPVPQPAGLRVWRQ